MHKASIEVCRRDNRVQQFGYLWKKFTCMQTIDTLIYSALTGAYMIESVIYHWQCNEARSDDAPDADVSSVITSASGRKGPEAGKGYVLMFVFLWDFYYIAHVCIIIDLLTRNLVFVRTYSCVGHSRVRWRCPWRDTALWILQTCSY